MRRHCHLDRIPGRRPCRTRPRSNASHAHRRARARRRLRQSDAGTPSTRRDIDGERGERREDDGELRRVDVRRPARANRVVERRIRRLARPRRRRPPQVRAPEVPAESSCQRCSDESDGSSVACHATRRCRRRRAADCPASTGVRDGRLDRDGALASDADRRPREKHRYEDDNRGRRQRTSGSPPRTRPRACPKEHRQQPE